MVAEEMWSSEHFPGTSVGVFGPLPLLPCVGTPKLHTRFGAVGSGLDWEVAVADCVDCHFKFHVRSRWSVLCRSCKRSK